MTTSTEAMRELRLQRLAAGLCQSCGDRPPLDGRKACEQCLADQAKRARARRAQQVAGLSGLREEPRARERRDHRRAHAAPVEDIFLRTMPYGPRDNRVAG